LNKLNEKFGDSFFKNHFGKNYLYKPNFIENFENIMSLDILDEMLSKTNIWNNYNFIMMLDQKKINYSHYSSPSLDTDGQNYRPDVNKVQNLVSRGASIILNDIQKHNLNLLKFVDELQKLTNGRCQGNLYFSMASHQAFGPHFDLHDVFAIHFEGEKVWNIYENIEKSPINHPVFKLSEDERRKRAGKIIEQVTLKPGDLLYIPRGQYHDALASQNGAIHIAFGLTYIKSIDVMTSLWQNLILNEFMRSDIKVNPNKDDLQSLLKKLSNELNNVINSKETLDVVTNAIHNWTYEMQAYSIKNIVSDGTTYFVDNTIKLQIKENKSYLTSLKGSVQIPDKFINIIDYILKQETINEKNLKDQFKEVSINIITECIDSLKKMNVIK
tara:strand:- start:113 stop:1267 length:1155 start_codon:yes stop_codon:yes gene_type:complete